MLATSHLDRGTTRRYSRAPAPGQGPSGPPKKLSLLIVPCPDFSVLLVPTGRLTSHLYDDFVRSRGATVCLFEFVDCEMESMVFLQV
jgi:hypothetical protein